MAARADNPLALLSAVTWVLLGALSAGSAVAGEAPKALAAHASTHLAALAKNDSFSGVVLVAKGGKPVFQQAYGYANLADKVTNRLDTRFNMASMGKMVTAVAVMQLMEAGKLSLAAKVGTYLPEYPNAAVREQVSIEQLLTHSSGMGNFWEQMADKAKERYRAVSDYLPLFANDKLAFEPGKGFLYSNNGYTVLGLIIEAVSGQSYFDYVREHIYKPCGMLDTEAFELDAPVPRVAMGYSRDANRPGQMVSNIYVNTYKGSPAGGSYTTASDLLKFANAVTGNKLLSAQTTQLLTSGKVNYGKRRYAYGFTEETVNGHRLISHGGGNTGIADELQIYSDLGYTVVIMTNGDVENFWDVQNFFKRELGGPSPETESYDFTKKVADTAVARGYDAGAAWLNANATHPPLRGGVLEQTVDKLLWQGKAAQAINLARLYALARPKDAYAWLGLGKAQERMGDKAQAIAAYQKYLALEPEDTDIKAKLQKLGAL